jgi:hypothetical protein
MVIIEYIFMDIFISGRRKKKISRKCKYICDNLFLKNSFLFLQEIFGEGDMARETYETHRIFENNATIL